MSGAMSYHSGLAAEGQVAAYYQASHHSIAARRWRGHSGEIDLILRHGESIVFVEVKRAESFARAAERLSQAQMQRIWNSASEFLAGEPSGQDTDVRFDVALVDGRGCIRIIENALCF